MNVSIIGASGYVGGELLRLLLSHPHVRIQQVTSETNAGKFVHSIHPNLRKITPLKFSSIQDLNPCDLLFAALPHGRFMSQFSELRSLAPRIIDLSADFRLRRAQDYKTWYGIEHADAESLGHFVYGVVELHREEIRKASYVTGAGCLATAAILGLKPIFETGLAQNNEAVVEAKVGSSAAGNASSLSTHHPERCGAVRSFQPTGHRHTAEMIQELGFHGEPKIHFTATAVELVRGVLATAQVFLSDNPDEKDIWNVYRRAYSEEPFIRIVKEKKGVYRYPEPKILIGSNFCDIGFEKDEHSNRLVVLSALDNLTKGAAGNAVQAMNVMCGWDERLGLEFPGLHPV